jgi:DNA-binding Lrp family transcriptional regulator
MGAVSGAERVGRQCLALLSLYREQGPLTDAEAASLMEVERTTICARRNELRRRGLVKAIDTVVGHYLIRNMRWGLA